MTAWLAAQFLRAQGHPHPDPPCEHSPSDTCPPLTATTTTKEPKS